MKAVLMSIKPKWCEKIFNGEKTIEVRKFAPKLKTPFKVYVYCSNGDKLRLVNSLNTDGVSCMVENDEFVLNDILNGKVIGSFVCDGIDHIHTLGFDDKMSKQTCLTFGELSRYLGGVNGMFYGWHITEPKLFDKPKELSEFGKYNGQPIKRAFQSWGYCYGSDD